jgi:hypothetical protein
MRILRFVRGGMGVASSFTYPTSDGVVALTPYPAAGTDYNTPASPCTTVAQIQTALAAATAGQSIYVAGGTYGSLDLTGNASFAKGSSANPVRIKPADTSNRPIFKVTYASSSQALKLDGVSGVALEGLKFAIDDIPTTNVTRFVCRPTGTNSNIWVVGCDIYSNYMNNASSALEAWKGALVDKLHILGCHIYDIGQGFSTQGDNSEFAFNRFSRIQNDWCSVGEGLSEFSYYFNYTLTPESYDSNHSDGFQITTTASTSRDFTNIRVYNNFAICPADLRPDTVTNSSLARMQFVIIANDHSYPNAPTGIVVHSNKGRGCISNTILADWGASLIKDNEAWQIDGTYSGGSDIATVPDTKIFIGTAITGTASGNLAYKFVNDSLGAVTGQATANDFTKKCTFAEAQTALFAWLASGDFYQARALMNLPTDRFLPY